MHELSASASSSTVHEELATARKVAEEASAAAEAAKRDSLKHRGLLEIATAQADALELKQAVRVFFTAMSTCLLWIWVHVC